MSITVFRVYFECLGFWLYMNPKVLIAGFFINMIIKILLFCKHKYKDFLFQILSSLWATKDLLQYQMVLTALDQT